MTTTRIAGLPATKVVGPKQDDPNIRRVEYYVQQSKGHQYYILLMAPANSWDHFAGPFFTMIRTLSFE